MGKMVDRQSDFSGKVALLILFAIEQGYQVTLGDAYRDPRASFPYSFPGSCHANRLAIDLNLFRKGVYLSTMDDHMVLGKKWEAMGGTWGGRFNDPNHYSWGEGR